MKWKIPVACLIAASLVAFAVYTLLFSQRGAVHHWVVRGDDSALDRDLASHPESVHARNDIDQTPLHVAVIFRRESMLPLLFAAGADVNAQDRTGMTPLHIAALYGRASCAKLLLEHGAKLDIADVYGDTPLMTAAVFGKPNVYRLLLDQGARADRRNKEGLDARALAQKYKQADMIAYFDSVNVGAMPSSPQP